MSIVETLLTNLAQEFRTQAVYVGENWVLSLLTAQDGTQYAGVASAPLVFSEDARFPVGQYPLIEDAGTIAQLLVSKDNSESSVGLATVNALLCAEKIPVSDADAADWLSQAAKNRQVAVFGRFPFINEEVRPFANEVWVFEQNPAEGEFSAKDMPEILPKAELVAITGSTIINHTIDNILAHTASDSTIAILGPSTPLSPRLFEQGIKALFGVQVIDIQSAIESIQVGSSFRKMQGLRRVSLFKTEML